MKLIRVREAAAKYKVSPFTFYRWRYEGKFPQLFAKIGALLFIDEAELRKLARESQKG